MNEMKHNYKHLTRTNMALMVASLLILCQIANAQPGYRQRVYPEPYRPDDGSYSYSRRVPRWADPRMRTDSPQPFIKFGIHFDPLISWFSTNNYNIRSEGLVAGFNLGFSYNRYFSSNYSFSSGINIISAGGKLVYNETTSITLKNYYNEIVTVGPGEVIKHRIYYLSIPLGLKLETNPNGYGSFFTDFGIDPKIAVGSKTDIPSIHIIGGNAVPDLTIFNLSYHIMAGMEYPLGEYNTAAIGIRFENIFSDVTRNNGNRPFEVVTDKFISFRLGINF